MEDSRRGHRAAVLDGVLDGLLVLGAGLVVVLTLTPAGGAGWQWGAPLVELRWYATALDSPTSLVQLLGNLVLLVPVTVPAVLRRPALATPLRLGPLCIALAAGVEMLQWALPLGRVVSPVDAALNAAGALVAGLLAARLHRITRAGCTA